MTGNECIIKPETKVLVVGLGKSGLSMIRFLRKLGADVRASDSTPKDAVAAEIFTELSDMGVEYEVGGHTSDFFISAEMIFASPGVPLNIKELEDARRNNIPVLGEMALAIPYLKTPVVAITGTNGKSTVTTLVGEMLRAAGREVFVGGNIGTPLADYLIGPQSADVVVLEVSSYQLDTSGCFRPDVAVLLNISPDHLDRYASYEEYARSKFQIFANQQSDDHAILNYEDVEIRNRKKLWGKGPTYFFGNNIDEHNGAMLVENQVILKGLFAENNEHYDLQGTVFAEQPNAQNAMAAILAARLMGCTAEAVLKGLNNFKQLPHRVTLVGEIDGVCYYDDSKATNIGAVKAALEGMKEQVVLIAGGRDKGAEYDFLLNIVKQKVKGMILVGEAAEKMGATFKEVTDVKYAESMNDAVWQAHRIADKGDAVLLSPACASFDMFKSYGERGDVFCKAVQEIISNKILGDNEISSNVESVFSLSCD